MPERSSPKKLGDLLPGLLERLGLSKGVREHTVLERWPEIVGPKIAEVTTAERIRDGRLWVSVRHPAWRNELAFIKEELLAKVNREMGAEIVREIIFR